MWWIFAGVVIGALVLIVIYDICQKKHAILRNFPIIGHFRYLLESVGPELRQYIVTDNDEERPFSRDQRRWVYASAKKENNYFGFGTDNSIDSSPNYLIVKHATLGKPSPLPGEKGYDPEFTLPGAKILGAHRNRPGKFRPRSLLNISGMSFGSLSAHAVEALNRGSKLAGCLHNTGEGSVSPHHQHGGELIWQIGTGYFGCRTADGRFDMSLLKEVVDANPVRAIEVKLSQGAKPGMGGILPAAKITPEIARIRGIPMGQDCLSPARHAEFHDPDSLLDFVERIAQETGRPVGIKSAVGESEFWRELAHLMATTERGVDFIVVDGGEGGTGAGPLVFTDHVSLPFKLAMSRVYREFALRDLHEKITFVGSGKLGFPEVALFALALGCDLIHVGREAMLAIGCIQAQKCHTGHCPTGVTTHSRWLVRGLDPTDKAARVANYITTMRKELLMLCHACGVPHPALITNRHFEVLDGRHGSTTPGEMFGYKEEWCLPSEEDCREIERIMEDPAPRT